MANLVVAQYGKQISVISNNYMCRSIVDYISKEHSKVILPDPRFIKQQNTSLMVLTKLESSSEKEVHVTTSSYASEFKVK